MYRLKKIDMDHIPEKGPAVLIANHVSFIDFALITAVSPRPVVFVMDSGIFKMPLVKYFFIAAKAIPIAPARKNPELLKQAFERMDAVLDEGDLLCIFPEGKVTKTGEMNDFKAGIERIIEQNPVPVIPIALHGVWGSFFSRKTGFSNGFNASTFLV